MSRDPYLVDLAGQLAALAASSEHARRRRLWEEVLALRSTRAPVNFYVYEWVWARELGRDLLRYERGVEATVEKVDKITEIMKFGVMMTPALAVDGKVVSAGKVLSAEDVRRILETGN